jgi:hypothetical protein
MYVNFGRMITVPQKMIMIQTAEFGNMLPYIAKGTLRI